jgi:uncharacterized membrane protein HdeD (DUF308 family)
MAQGNAPRGARKPAWVWVAIAAIISAVLSLLWLVPLPITFLLIVLAVGMAVYDQRSAKRPRR